MKFLLSMILGLSLTSMALADENPVKNDPKPEDFLGKWVGAWDGIFAVQITITQNPETKELSALYEWEEQPGNPLNQMVRPAKLDGNKLLIGNGLIDLTLSAEDPTKAKAVGNFSKKRTADLVREVS